VALPNKKGTLLIQCLSDPISLAYDKRGFCRALKQIVESLLMNRIWASWPK